MNDPVQDLLDFHARSYFGNRENLYLREAQARAAYLALTAAEQEELAREAITRIDNGKTRFEQALLCLACFQPGSLEPFHQSLLARRILYPGVLYLGADADIAQQLVALCEDGHALAALAWIGDETAQAAFSRWRSDPPGWAGKLFLAPHRYAAVAGWELTSEGKRRDLFHPVAFPLVARAAAQADNAVTVGVPAEESCGWCGLRLVDLLQFRDIGAVLPDQGTRPVRVVTCHTCTCFGTVFTGYDADGHATWHARNERPSYLPNSSDLPTFPAGCS